jgi:hypothetical protein
MITKAERKEIKDLLELAADLATHRATFDPDWPNWRKVLFWDDFTPRLKAYKERAHKLTGAYVIL